MVVLEGKLVTKKPLDGEYFPLDGPVNSTKTCAASNICTCWCFVWHHFFVICHDSWCSQPCFTRQFLCLYTFPHLSHWYIPPLWILIRFVGLALLVSLRSSSSSDRTCRRDLRTVGLSSPSPSLRSPSRSGRSIWAPGRAEMSSSRAVSSSFGRTRLGVLSFQLNLPIVGPPPSVGMVCSVWGGRCQGSWRNKFALPWGW